MVYFPAYIRLPGIYTCHVEKKPIYQLLESQQRDASKVRTLPIGLTPRTTGRPGRQKLRVLFATYKSWPVRAMQKEKKSIPYLCHLQKTRHPNFALFPRNCLRQRHQWPFHNLLSTSVFYERPYRTPEKHIYIYNPFSSQIQIGSNPKNRWSTLLIFHVGYFFSPGFGCSVFNMEKSPLTVDEWPFWIALVSPSSFPKTWERRFWANFCEGFLRL